MQSSLFHLIVPFLSATQNGGVSFQASYSSTRGKWKSSSSSCSSCSGGVLISRLSVTGLIFRKEAMCLWPICSFTWG